MKGVKRAGILKSNDNNPSSWTAYYEVKIFLIHRHYILDESLENCGSFSNLSWKMSMRTDSPEELKGETFTYNQGKWIIEEVGAKKVEVWFEAPVDPGIGLVPDRLINYITTKRTPQQIDILKNRIHELNK